MSGDFVLPAIVDDQARGFWLGEHAGAVIVVHVASLGTPLDEAVSTFMSTLDGGHVSVDVLTDAPVPSQTDAQAYAHGLALPYRGRSRARRP